MKRVHIDCQKGIVVMTGREVPRLLLRMIRGAVGKSFVVKHYKGGRVVVTRYPDMSGVEASERQSVRRNLFREAVVYAKWIVGEEERKKTFRKTLPRKRRRHVYQAAIRLYMSRQGDTGWLRKQLAVKAMMRSGERAHKQAAMIDRQLEIANLQFAMSNERLLIGRWALVMQKPGALWAGACLASLGECVLERNLTKA